MSSTRAVEADSGNIGGKTSHEFHVLASSGEDTIAYATEGDYAANLEKAVSAAPAPRQDPSAELTKVATPNTKTIDEVAALLAVSPKQCVKTLIVHGEDGPVAIVLRGDHELNQVKAEKLDGVKAPLAFASDADIEAATGASVGSPRLRPRR